MKLLAIFVLHKEDETNVKILQNEFNLDNFGYFQRRHMQPLLVFSARAIIERTDRNVRQSIETDQNIDGTIHAYVRLDGLASVIISNNDYPKRVVHSLLDRVIEDFTKFYPSTSWENMPEGSGKMTSLNETLAKYQNPEEADPLMSLQKDLNETKEIMINTLALVLRRGENLEDLLERSKDLSIETKLFYRTVRKNNRCCTYF